MCLRSEEEPALEGSTMGAAKTALLLGAYGRAGRVRPVVDARAVYDPTEVLETATGEIGRSEPDDHAA